MTWHFRLAAAALTLIAAMPSHATPLNPDQQIVHVLNRLGYGPKPGEIEQVRQMGVARYIDRQLHPESIALPALLQARLSTLDAANANAGDVLAEFMAARTAAKSDDEEAKKRRRDVIGRIAEQTDEARIARAIDSPRQLEEVMVDFWFNHFNVFSGKGLDRALIGSYERDAIRPFALGSFRDLLGATAKHPAMLFYLDNWLSSAPDMPPRGANGKTKASGLNENYARELMELHTLGVDGGYTQRDVTELARMLTGWTFNPRDMARNQQTFVFDARRHDNGTKQWLSRTIAPQGQQEGELALDMLALHPATAKHLSYQLAQYFVQDDPPPALVARLSRRYLGTRGDIRAVLQTLFDSPEFMASDAVNAKFKTPWQFVISAVRASATPVLNIRPLLGTLNQLGMPLYGCQTPDGYKNTQAAWLNPDALTRRIAFAAALAAGRLPLALALLPIDDSSGTGMNKRKLEREAQGMRADVSVPASPPLDAARLLATLGTAISPDTRATMENNPPNLRAALLLGSPDFMQH